MATTVHLFRASEVPANITVGDFGAITVGILLQANLAGSLTGVRYYRSQTTAGQQTAGVWNQAGSLLASQAFTGETASGWQECVLSSPIALTAHQIFTVGVFMGSGGYPVTGTYFSPTGRGRQSPQGLLQAPVGQSNGRFTASGSLSLPTTTFNNNNYWIDATFSVPDNVVTLFPEAPTVANIDGVAPQVTIGMRFVVLAPGTCYGIRWFAGNGQHTDGAQYTALLFRGAGTLLASTSETQGLDAAGFWFNHIFTTPVHLDPGNVYTACLWRAGNANNAYDAAYFSAPITNYPLQAPASSDGGNCVISATTPSPPTTAPGTDTGVNYWLDALFIPDAVTGGSEPVIVWLE